MQQAVPVVSVPGFTMKLTINKGEKCPAFDILIIAIFPTLLYVIDLLTH
jgi:hypothetical protein